MFGFIKYKIYKCKQNIAKRVINESLDEIERMRNLAIGMSVCYHQTVLDEVLIERGYELVKRK